jgi:hypothetical protein
LVGASVFPIGIDSHEGGFDAVYPRFGIVGAFGNVDTLVGTEVSAPIEY